MFFKIKDKKQQPEASKFELVTAAGNFEPITPEKSSSPKVDCVQQPLPMDGLNNESCQGDAFFLDAFDEFLTDDFTAVVDSAHFASFMPSFEACGFDRPKTVRIFAGNITVTSATTMIIESSKLKNICVGMQFCRYSNIYVVTDIQSKTVMFECLKKVQ